MTWSGDNGSECFPTFDGIKRTLLKSDNHSIMEIIPKNCFSIEKQVIVCFGTQLFSHFKGSILSRFHVLICCHCEHFFSLEIPEYDKARCHEIQFAQIPLAQCHLTLENYLTRSSEKNSFYSKNMSE